MQKNLKLYVGCLLALSVSAAAQGPRSREWLTWGGNAERSGWNRGETSLTKNNIKNLELKWKAKIDQAVPIEIESGASMLTAPLVVEGVRTPQGSKALVLTLAASNTVTALDPASGKIQWQRTLDKAVPPVGTANWICTNTSTATPVVDKAKGILYLLGADGRLHSLALGTGQDELPPVEFVAPYSRNWSLNLVDGVLYTTVGRGCGNAPAAEGNAPPARAGGDGSVEGGGRQAGRGGRGAAPSVPAHMIAMDLNDPKRPISRFMTSTARPSGAWSRAGMAWAGNSVLVQTADGVWDPSKNLWGETLLRLSPRTLQLMDYFTPPNVDDLNAKDLDYGSGGVVAFADGNRQFVVSGGKDGTIYLLDGASLGGANHQTPLFSLKTGNDAMLYASNGIWGAPATALDARNQRWIYFPMWGPPSKEAAFKRTNGDAPDGNIQALQLSTAGGKPSLLPMWVSRNFSVPDSPVVANGMVFGISTGENTLQRHADPRYLERYRKPGAPPLSPQGTLTAEERGQQVGNTILYALDAETGQELYSSRDLIDDWTHLSSVTVANGQVYVTTRQSYVYAFGLKK
ncbi:MAG: PQQ-binding-like beta-propeller repeat protein [Vicinamibacterales bacterium]|nr:PQQ-binding-like beta-propeller repeat protein [Vicinamibacterales bacterium]